MRDRTIAEKREGWTRREVLFGPLGGFLASSGFSFLEGCTKPKENADVHISKLATYESDIASVVVAGHINTHPLVIRGAAEAFLRAGVSKVLVAEGPGHSRDSLLMLEESGLGEGLREDRISFVALNYVAAYTVENTGRRT